MAFSTEPELQTSENTEQVTSTEQAQTPETPEVQQVAPPAPAYNVSVESEYDIPFVIEEVPPSVIIRTPEATQELGTLISTILPVQPEQAGLELAEGNDTLLRESESYLRSIIQDEHINNTEVALQEAKTPEESLEILKKASEGQDGEISLKELREYFVQARANPTLATGSQISDHIERGIFMAQEIDKVEARVWENTDLMSVLGDLGELVIPATGYAEEEYMKYKESLDSILVKLDKAPTDKKMEVLNSVLDTWIESETMLLGRNNSLLVADRIDSFRDAVLDGGHLLADGQISDEQFHDMIQTALFGTLAAQEFKAVGKGLIGVAKFMMNSIFPKKPKSTAKETEFTSDALEGEFIPFVATKEVSTGDEGVHIFRTGSKAVDTEIAFKPESFLEYKDEGFKSVMQKHGMTEEQVMDRMAPTFMNDASVAWGNIWDETTELTDLLLLDEDAASIGMHRARQLEKMSGGSLKQIDSGTALLPNDVEGSMGDFIITLGDSNKKGFKTPEEAAEAGSLGLAGADFKITEMNGQFFVQKTVQHKFDPTTDVTHLFETYSAKSDEGIGFFKDPLRQLGEEVLNGVFVMKNVNRSKVSTRIKKFNKAIKSFTHHKSVKLNKALSYGDNNSYQFTSPEDMASRLGMDPSEITKDIWDSYTELRGIMDDLYAVRNENYRSLKESQGYRLTDIGEQSVLARPVKEADSAVYDPVTGRTISEVPDGMLLVRSDEAVVGADGKLYRHFVIKPEDAHELPTQLLRKREGHIDRSYRDTGWTIKVKKKRTVGGKEEVHDATTHIVKNRRQAVKAMEKMIQDEGLDPDSVELVRARENPDLETVYGDPDSIQYNYTPAHSRRRGEQLRGSEGLAPVLNPLESIQKSIYSFQREFDQPFVQSLKQRFKNQYRDHLREGGKWSTDFNTMFDASKASDEVKHSAQRWHNYIQGMQRQQVSPWMNRLDKWIETLLMNVVDAPATELSRRAQRFTAQMVIVGRPLYQVPQNLMQAVYIAMKYPYIGTKSVAQMPFALDAMFRKDTKFLSKVLGVSGEDAKQFIKMADESGMWDSSVGRADDFLNMAADDFGSTAAGMFPFYAKKYGAGLVKTPLAVSRHLQEGSIKLVNLYAMLAEFNEQVVRKGKRMNASTKKDILFNSQKMTQTQNGMNQFLYQNSANFSSVMFQFMQHTHKLLLDVVLDPVVKATTNKNIGRSASPYASSRAQAFLSLGGLYMLFGFNGIFGENGGNYFTDRIREEYPELQDDLALQPAFEGGVINMFVNNAFFGGEKGKADVTAVLNPSSFMDSVYDFYLADFGTVDVFGASASVAGSLKDAYDTAKILSEAPDDYITTEEKAMEVVNSIAGIVRGWSDYERSWIAGQFGTWVNKKNFTGQLKITNEEAWLAMFNVTPKLVNDNYNRRGSFHGDSRGTDTNKVVNVLSKMMNRDLAEAKADGRLSLQLSHEIIRKYVMTAKMMTDPLQHAKISQGFRDKVGTRSRTYIDYLKPYMDDEGIEDRIKGLKGLLQKAETPEMKRKIEATIEYMEMITMTNKEVWGDKNE